MDRDTEIPMEKGEYAEGLKKASCAGVHVELLEFAGLGCKGSLFRFVNLVLECYSIPIAAAPLLPPIHVRAHFLGRKRFGPDLVSQAWSLLSYMLHSKALFPSVYVGVGDGGGIHTPCPGPKSAREHSGSSDSHPTGLKSWSLGS